MNDFKQLIKLLQETVDDFQRTIPGIQQNILDELRMRLRDIDLRGGRIAVSSANIRLIAQIRAKLLDIVLNPEYIDAVKKYASVFSQITDMQNSYFNNISDKFSPPNFTKALQTQAVAAVVDNLTERGIGANVVAGIEDILRTNITSGGSYSQLQQILEDNVVNNSKGDGSLARYTKQITTDAVNQYSAQYTQVVSSDLGLEWFVYAGSNIETSRPFCLACTKKRYIHQSEIPALLEGNFPEFDDFDGKMYKGLPAGMIPGTNPSNFQINRGGYNCGHQLRPVTANAVPKDIRDQFE